MVIALLIPTVVSFLLLGAHFLRQGSLTLVVISLVVPLALFIRHRWAVRTVQAVLVIASLEWIRTAVMRVEERIEDGDSWTRLAIILGVVALWTLCSALLFETPPLRRRYRRTTPDKITPDSKSP
jgi:hypothetical protein